MFDIQSGNAKTMNQNSELIITGELSSQAAKELIPMAGIYGTVKLVKTQSNDEFHPEVVKCKFVSYANDLPLTKKDFETTAWSTIKPSGRGIN